MSRPRYDDDTKARAVALAVEHGPTEAGRLTGVKPGTIRSWCSRSGVATEAAERTAAATDAAKARRETKREELRTLLIEKAVDLVNRMDEEHIDFRGKDAGRVTFPKAPAQACQQYATAAAILLDKFRLELGESTDRTARVTEPVTDAEHLLDELDAKRKARAA
jgi:transposase-like protein